MSPLSHADQLRYITDGRIVEAVDLHLQGDWSQRTRLSCFAMALVGSFWMGIIDSREPSLNESLGSLFACTPTSSSPAFFATRESARYFGARSLARQLQPTSS